MKLRAIIALSSAALLTVVFALVSGAGPTCTSDADLDGVCDDPGALSDNCVGVANPGQRDDDEDGYGNICDWDVTQDCIGGGPDLIPIFAKTFNASPWVPKLEGAFDVNEDNVVGGPDLVIVFANTFNPPGPSSRTCAACAAVAGTGVCP